MTFKRIHPGMIAAVLGLLIGCPTPAHAVQVRVLDLAAVDGDLQFDTGRKSTRLKLFPDSFSGTMEFKGDGPVILYKMVFHDDTTRKQVACTVTIPQGMEQGLLILVPGDESKAVDRKVVPDEAGFVSVGAPLIYNYIWYDDSLKARPPGMIEFRNLSRLPIALQIEQTRLVLAPQDQAQVPLTPGAKRMPLRAAAQINGQWKLFRSNPLSTRNPDRMLVILRDGSSSSRGISAEGEPDIMMISLFDWPPPPPSPDAGPMLSSNRR